MNAMPRRTGELKLGSGGLKKSHFPFWRLLWVSPSAVPAGLQTRLGQPEFFT